MDISSELQTLCDPIQQAISDFSKHTDINKLLESIRRELIQFAETLIVAVIQPLLVSHDFLRELKMEAAKKALRFNGYRDISVRLITGKRIALRSPYFIKARPKKYRKRRKGNGGGHLALQWLGFIDHISMQLASVASQAALLCPSFEIARQTLTHHGIDLGVKTIQRIIKRIGRQAMGHRSSITLNATDHSDGRTVLVCIDGGRLRERKTKRGRRALGQNGKAITRIGASRPRS